MSEEKQLKDQRIPIMMSAAEVEALDDWSFKNRIRSRGEAIRRLCQLGLTVEDRIELLDASRDALQGAFRALVDALNIGERYEKEDFPATDIERAFTYTINRVAEMDLAIYELSRFAEQVRSSKNIEEISANRSERLERIREALLEVEGKS